jgi:hypothetical protein
MPVFFKRIDRPSDAAIDATPSHRASACEWRNLSFSHLRQQWEFDRLFLKEKLLEHLTLIYERFFVEGFDSKRFSPRVLCSAQASNPSSSEFNWSADSAIDR